MAVVFKKPRFATARTADDTICAVFSKDDINQKLAGPTYFRSALSAF
jgi:hypothetical protein